MTNHPRPGLWQRLLTSLGGALKRGILGRSTHASVNQFTGSDAYWDRVIAAQGGWPQEQLPDQDRAVLHAGPATRDTSGRPPEPAEEPSPEETEAPPRGETEAIVSTARDQLEQLLEREVESVSGFERSDGRWCVTLEVVEVRRIPESTDVLGSYEVVLDEDRNLVSFGQTRRYRRSQVEEG